MDNKAYAPQTRNDFLSSLCWLLASWQGSEFMHGMATWTGTLYLNVV